MTRIDNNQQLLALFQKQLGNLAKTKRKTIQKSGGKNRAGTNGVNAITQLVLNPDLEESDIHRALVQGLLADAFGNSIMNDARFQEIVTRTTKIIRSDKETYALLEQAVDELGNMSADADQGPTKD